MSSGSESPSSSSRSGSASGTPPASVPSSGASGKEARRRRRDPDTMIPARSKRLGIESFVMRVVATAGIVGIGVAIAAIMVSQDAAGWLVGLVVSIVSVLLAGILWSSRRL